MTDDNLKTQEAIEQVFAVWDAFCTKLGEIAEMDADDRRALVLSAMLELNADRQKLASEPDLVGFQLPSLPEIETLSDRFQSGRVTVGEYRTRLLSSAYRLDLEVPSAWSRASRMDRALLNAVWYEHLILYDENIFPADDLEGEELHRAEDRLATAMETFRKSVYRYRQQARGQKLFKFDDDSLGVEVVDAEEVLFKHLPKRRGPPPKSG